MAEKNISETGSQFFIASLFQINFNALTGFTEKPYSIFNVYEPEVRFLLIIKNLFFRLST